MPADPTPLIQIENLSYRRGDRLIFDGLNVVVPRGTVTAIMGPSGTGKTTLLKLIGAQLRPSGGRILVDGEDVHRQSGAALYKLRRRMGMLFQTGALLTDLNVFENVAFPLRENTRLPEGVLRSLVLMKLQSVGLRGARDLMPSELSGGMARRVALARAIALDPMMIMYDEPFTGLDPITMDTIVSLIKRLNDGLGLTSIVVSHDVPETLSIANQIYLISGGKVMAQGTPAELRDNTSPWVRQFLDGEADGPVPFHYPAPDYADDLLGSAR
ncbi:ATP-binding cassette domain-containing protein [Acidihalobacter ferrooxydans]|uniref:ABC transporter ATP-binding protein n=1 Tax=Acidihalobacter ferrooxydans TaxID=1765967 RepID=A0A1P8UF44_9GAMM|nr:ATP-binding cassette domain-containing protein [Acidihalobacter ferrooxydans]APZ42455.1 ABC transporter ATP-binding protein [Acidihalobacter ferrooxydans]